jgi:polysaccharide export outer membrane protein
MSRLVYQAALWLALATALCAQTPALQKRESGYRIQPGDAVEVQYRYTPEFNAKATVQPDGKIAIPIAGAVPVGGLTLEEARAAITAIAAQRLREPEVILLLADFVKPTFTVAGQVARPGRYDVRGGITAVDAVAISGGFTTSAKHSQVILVRRLNDEYADVRVMNLKRVMSAAGIKEDIKIQDGDLLIVPQNRVSKVERYVQWGQLYAGFGIWRR